MANKKLLAFGTAAVLAILLLALLLSRGGEKPAQDAIAAQPAQPSFEPLSSEPAQPSQQIPLQPFAKPLGNISHQSVKSDSSINAVIDSSQKLDWNVMGDAL